MRSRTFCFFVVPLLFLPLAVAAKDKDKDKSQLPKLVVSAQYVMVITECGDPAEQPLNPHIMAEDRQAVSDVQNAIEKWGRYTIAYRPQDADLILVVRKGRLADAVLGADIHAESRNPNGSNQRQNSAPAGPDDAENPCGTGLGPSSPGFSVHPETSGDAGDPLDMLVLYSTSMGSQTNSPPLWRGRRADGLKAPQMRLVEDLRAKVEAAAKAP
jgi:hypothetical protein